MNHHLQPISEIQEQFITSSQGLNAKEVDARLKRHRKTNSSKKGKLLL
jgi:hypothetical protein